MTNAKEPLVSATREPENLFFDIERAKQTIRLRKELLSALVDVKNDVVKKGKGQYKKKSYWRKLAIVAGISIEKREEWKEADTNNRITYFVTVRAILPSGQFMDGAGACTQTEDPFGHSGRLHYIRATAETRAKNRAISDLLAFGEVSAEEIDEPVQDTPRETVPAAAAQAQTPTPSESAITQEDEQASYTFIQLLHRVLPGSAQKLVSENVAKRFAPREVEMHVKQTLAHEMSEIHKQGYMSIDTMKTMCLTKFPETDFARLNVEQTVELLSDIQEAICGQNKA